MQYLIENKKIDTIETSLAQFRQVILQHCADQPDAVRNTVLQAFEQLQAHHLKAFDNLATARNQFADLFEHSPLSFVILDNKLKIVEANTQARSLLGLELNDSQQLIQKSFTGFVLQGLSNLLSWIYTPDNISIDVTLSGRLPAIHAKLYQSDYTIKGRDYILLSILPIQKEHELMQSLLTYKMVFEYAQDGIMVVGDDHKILDVNPEFTRITGYQRAEVLGQNPKILSSGKQSSEFYDDMYQQLQQDGFWKGVLENRTKNGELYHEELQISVIYDKSERKRQVTHYVAIFRNIDNRLEKEKLLQYQAETDVLTGLLNRKGFDRIYQELFTTAQQKGEELTLIFIDLDNFKNLNDQYGHNYGDELLRVFAKRLRNGLKERDAVARLGGDEFVILLYREVPTAAMKRIINKLNQNINQVYQIFDLEYQCYASVGIANYPHDAIDMTSLMQAADVAMYQAKKAGKNRFQFYDDALYKHELKHEQLLNEIHRAIDHNEFENFLQPLVNIENNKIVGFEALARWRKTDNSIVLPNQFLPHIENTEAMITLSKRLIRSILLELKTWLQFGFNWPVSINLNACQLSHPAIFQEFQKISQESPELIPLLKIEVTETTLFENNDAVEQTLKRLQEIGIPILLDDFGTGYSSIYSLKKFSFQSIKIDQSFIKEIGKSGENDTLFLDGIIQLLQTLDLEIICEGVEHQTQADYLLAKGCHVAQGFHYYRPMDKQAVWQLLTTKRETTIKE